MRINSIVNLNFSKNKQLGLKKQNNCLFSDVFIKSTPSFKSNIEPEDQSFRSFCNWASDTGYTDKIAQDISNLKGDIIGEGAEGIIYEIPGTDKWVLKENKTAFYAPKDNDEISIKSTNDIIPSMNIGQKIGVVQIPCDETHAYIFEVKKKQSGVAMGVEKDNYKIHSDSEIDKHLNSLRFLAEAPQSTFDKLISDIKKVHDKGYLFDCYNPNNFLFDEANQSINFVDIQDFYKRNESQFGNILYALLDTTFYLSLKKENPPELAAIEASKSYVEDILPKFIKSMKDAKVKFGYTDMFIKLLKSDLFDKALCTMSKDARDDELRRRGVL